MKIDGIGFNKAHFSKMSEGDFLKELDGEGYKHVYAGKDRKDKLKEVYKLLKGKQEEPVK